MKYIDLYSGVGGFRVAIDNKKNNCVFSAEINKFSIETYKKNFGDNSYFDMDSLIGKNNEEIRKIIPKHDLIVGGFPCQPFSKAGERKGFKTNDTKGTQFFNILKIIDAHNPSHIFLENVRNFSSHDNGNTWTVVKEELIKRGYKVIAEPLIISPISFGVPQNRERVFIIASKKFDPNSVEVSDFFEKQVKMMEIIEPNDGSEVISGDKLKAIKAWGELAKKLKPKMTGQIPVIWLDEMLSNKIEKNIPEWKKIMINKMKRFYEENKIVIDEIINKYDLTNLPRGLRKLEWQAGDETDIKKTIVTFRPSGVRVKAKPIFPTLVAIVQIPVIFDKDLNKFREITPREAANLQSFPKKFKINENKQQAFKQFGNAVNVKVIEGIYNKFFKKYE